MKKLYYTVTPETNNAPNVFNREDYLTGWIEVKVYEVVDNEIEKLFDLSCQSKVEDCINMYLKDNGMGDKNYKLELL